MRRRRPLPSSSTPAVRRSPSRSSTPGPSSNAQGRSRSHSREHRIVAAERRPRVLRARVASRSLGRPSAVVRDEQLVAAVVDRRCRELARVAPMSISAWSALNQRSRSSQGTAAFAGEVDGSTKSAVSPSRRSCRPCSGRSRNGAAVRLLADERDHAGPQLARELLEPLGAAREVAGAQVARAGRRPVGGVRDADPERQQVELLRRIEEARREPGRVEQAPEVVARVREVGVRRVREAAGIDAAEDDARARARARPGRRRVWAPAGYAASGSRASRRASNASRIRSVSAAGDSVIEGSAGRDDLDGVLAAPPAVASEVALFLAQRPQPLSRTER